MEKVSTVMSNFDQIIFHAHEKHRCHSYVSVTLNKTLICVKFLQLINDKNFISMSIEFLISSEIETDRAKNTIFPVTNFKQYRTQWNKQYYITIG